MRCALLLGAALVLSGGEARADAFDALALRPGVRVSEAVAGAQVAGRWRGRQLAIEVDALPGVLESQRVVLTVGGGGDRVSAIHIQIFAHRGASERDLHRLADDVRRRLLDVFGAPEWERWDPRRSRRDGAGEEEGRAIEWRLPDRSIVRAGIPERLDGRRAVEIAITSTPFGSRDRFWGADDFDPDAR